MLLARASFSLGVIDARGGEKSEKAVRVSMTEKQRSKSGAQALVAELPKLTRPTSTSPQRK